MLCSILEFCIQFILEKLSSNTVKKKTKQEEKDKNAHPTNEEKWDGNVEELFIFFFICLLKKKMGICGAHCSHSFDAIMCVAHCDVRHRENELSQTKWKQKKNKNIS